ncbi:MFS transporter [Rufibacter tibetensis]|uniref:MFS transporter n=1 Tax=Rufibacter tibetensis TaxID=512763 RepID=A0A0P0C869_9BACT|nr:MFS transporter [Rufibacter tibetensis]ALI99662.1 MFS transporter [Rufibacter tibetensis]
MLSLVSSPVSRKAHRLAVSALFFLQGLCFSSWGSRIPSIQQKLHLSEAELGGVLFSLPVGLMLSLPFTGWLTSRIGSRKVVTIALLIYSTTLVMIGMSQTTLHLVAVLFLFGFASNMANISVNTQAVGVESLYNKSIMASFHGLWSLAGFFGAAIGTVMIGADVEPLQHFFVIMAVVLAGVAVAYQYAFPKDAPAPADQPLFVMPDKSLMGLGLIAFCSLICEGAMFDWSGVYFQKVVGAEKAWIAAGYTAFMSTMAFTRFIADWLTTKLGLKRVLQLSGIFTAVGLMISVLLPNLVTAIIGFLLVGAGVSAVVPLVYGVAGKTKTMAPSMALAAVSTIGFAGFLVGPPLIGMLAGISSLRLSFATIALMGIGVALLSSRIKTEEG